ncbi:MAG: hypothetical protein IGS03_19220 [Candidatus Sericytochromatia bacterium]|nr:hypothetical protein [Candidatus Sericytochromatia bacterium]
MQPAGDAEELPLDLSAQGRARDALDLFDLPALPEQAELDWAAELEQRLQQSGTEPTADEAERYAALMQQLVAAADLYPALSLAEIQAAQDLVTRLQAGDQVLTGDERTMLRQLLTRLLAESQQALEAWLARQPMSLKPVTAADQRAARDMLQRLQQGELLSAEEQQALGQILKALQL